MSNLGYANRANLEYIESIYQTYQSNPNEVPSDWQRFFEGVDFSQNLGGAVSSKELDVYNLIKAYRDYGHFEANLDPLSMAPRHDGVLELKKFNLTEADLKAKFSIGSIVGMPNATLEDIIKHLRRSYCGTISCQISDTLPKVRTWFEREFEKSEFKLSNAERKLAYQHVARTETLERFFQTRFLGTKRFSIEGADAMIPMMEWMAVKGAALKVEEIVIGMAHRGRINVLANYMDRELKMVLAEFDGHYTIDETEFDGDVKYHMGFSSDKQTPNGNVHLSLAFNPSHLEAVNGVVLGMTRAKQRRRKDTQNREKVVPLLIHGDAAFAGQGVVPECLQMSQLPGYRIGGTVHIIVDNQVGFTTSPEAGRSSPYASDIAKTQQIPVIHVNGDDTDAAIRAMDIAIRYRQEFKADVVINLMCYRRYGHNEADEPAFTQPVMYDIIRSHPTLRVIYGKRLIKEGVIDEAFYESFYQEKLDKLQAILEGVRKDHPVIKPPAFGALWSGLRRPKPEDFDKPVKTSVSLEVLQKVANCLTTLPQNFNLHPKLARLLDSRKEMVFKGEGIDWGMGELLAYGTVVEEGNSVRLSGQDCIRGTFSHRHSGFYDVKTNELYKPLSQLNPEVQFCVYNSLLSEMAVLAFEYGNSISDPTFLTLWEAQFGDFANGAQIIIDQFLASGEQKWLRMSGLVLLLPHGYEGQGPEHSSARLERFLQLCAQGNMQVVNLTTPAQIFHGLRRQVRRDFRVPLVVMSPKSLLRHPKAVSSLVDFTDGQFQEVIGDHAVNPDQVETAVLVSGKLYYELLEKRTALGNEGLKFALIRVEQLYPYPNGQIQHQFKKYKNLKHVTWAQEEPKNMGAWSFIYFRLQDTLTQMGSRADIKYVGRGFRASPATGSMKNHVKEQNEILEAVFQSQK